MYVASVVWLRHCLKSSLCLRLYSGVCCQWLCNVIDVLPGLHLNLLEGMPVSAPETVYTLLDEHGYFWDRFNMPDRLAAHKVDMAQVRVTGSSGHSVPLCLPLG